MKSVFTSLILLISLSGWAQNDKRTISIRQQLDGLWQLDISTDSASWENNMNYIPRFQFLDGDRIAFIKRNRVKLTTYIIAFSTSDTLLIFQDVCLKLRSSWNGNIWSVNEIRPTGEKEDHEGKLIKIGPSIPLSINLASAYSVEDSRKKLTAPPSNATFSQSILELNEDFTFRWDSIGEGTWKLDSVQAILHFQTTTKKLAYDILDYSPHKLALIKSQRTEYEFIINFATLRYLSEEREKQAISDSIRVVDSVAAVAAMNEGLFLRELKSDPASFWSKFSGTKKLTILSQPTKEPYQLIWNENGAFILRSGKKEKKYKWELLKVEHDHVQLIITRSGKEELSLLELYIDGNLHQITLIDPFTGKLETFLLNK